MRHLIEMNRFLIFIFLCFCFLNLNGQDIELAGGININKFYDFPKDDGISTHYKGDNSYTLAISCGDTLFNSFYSKFGLILDNYKGSIYTIGGALGGGSSTKADVNKTILSLNISPLNFRIDKDLRLNLGLSFNYLLKHKMIGYHTGQQLGYTGQYISLENNSDPYVNNFTFGLTGCIAYELKFKETWSLVPQYLINVGLKNEFRNLEANTKSLRQYFEIGILKRLNLKP
jgi:hypothetical protein